MFAYNQGKLTVQSSERTARLEKRRLRNEAICQKTLELDLLSTANDSPSEEDRTNTSLSAQQANAVDQQAAAVDPTLSATAVDPSTQQAAAADPTLSATAVDPSTQQATAVDPTLSATAVDPSLPAQQATAVNSSLPAQQAAAADPTLSAAAVDPSTQQATAVDPTLSATAVDPSLPAQQATAVNSSLPAQQPTASNLSLSSALQATAADLCLLAQQADLSLSSALQSTAANLCRLAQQANLTLPALQHATGGNISSAQQVSSVQVPVPTVCYVPVPISSKTNCCDLIRNNDDATKFYTGLNSWGLFEHLASFLSKQYKSIHLSRYVHIVKYSPEDSLLLVLMRFRLNSRLEDLLYRFSIPISTINNIVQNWIDIMHESLKFLINWPSQEVIRANMPQVFKDLYPRSRCIIDCSEVFIERPCAYDARAQSYSNYKRHNTIKFLIAVAPHGAITFLSKCWGGRATDKCITEQSGFLRLLDPEDVILADRGFDIADDLRIYGARLELPSFTRGKKQLSLEEVEHSKRLSKVRIHVERVIGLLKNKYTILQSILPILVWSNINTTKITLMWTRF